MTFFPGIAGVADYVGVAGPGGGPQAVVVDGKTGAAVVSFFAFEPGFTGGVFVAAADLDGDGRAEVVVSPDQGGGPVAAVYAGAKHAAGTGGDAARIVRFFGIDEPSFRGGARPTLGDVTGDGTADLVVSAESHCHVHPIPWRAEDVENPAGGGAAPDPWQGPLRPVDVAGAGDRCGVNSSGYGPMNAGWCQARRGLRTG